MSFVSAIMGTAERMPLPDVIVRAAVGPEPIVPPPRVRGAQTPGLGPCKELRIAAGPTRPHDGLEARGGPATRLQAVCRSV